MDNLDDIRQEIRTIATGAAMAGQLAHQTQCNLVEFGGSFTQALARVHDRLAELERSFARHHALQLGLIAQMQGKSWQEAADSYLKSQGLGTTEELQQATQITTDLLGRLGVKDGADGEAG